MRYNPSDAQQCLPAGRYPALISAVEEKESKPKADGSTVPMVVVLYTVYSERGNRKITDYTTIPNGLWRLKGLAKAIGQEAAFNSGEFNPNDYLGHTLDVELEIEADKTGQYPDKNRIKSWLPSRTKGGQAAPAATRRADAKPNDGPDESRIPF